MATQPDDPAVDELVEYYRSLAGEHPDWDDYRKVMVADKRGAGDGLKPTPRRYGMTSSR